MTIQLKPLFEGVAVGVVFGSITLAFDIPWYMSAIIAALAAVGGYRNSIKMSAEQTSKHGRNSHNDSTDIE
ncbi:hypothetical protein CBF23_004150 [Marinomonas agarivorans]|nr:hypothetical protein CBF23_004150 [Marinomonas agarivorans]